MKNVVVREGRFGQYEQVNDSVVWINWTRQISAEGITERDRVPGPGVFYGQIREKDDPDTAYDCVVKCHLSEAFTEGSRREVADKRAAANIKLLKQARSPVNKGKADHDLAYHVVSSYATETIETHGRRRYILQPLELCSANLQHHLIREAQYSPQPEVNNYGARKKLLRDIVCGLKFVHNKGFSHRKLEPASILLTEDDQGNIVAKLSDFALVKEDNARYGETTRLAHPGSLGYIAPELQNRKEGDGSYKKSMDIFSLGIVAYQLMAVNCPASEQLPHPFDSQHPDQESKYDRMVRLQMAINEGKLPSKWQDGLDPQDAEACNLIECMLLRDPAMRPDVNEVLQHPFFWAQEERMKHLVDLSNWLRARPRDLGLKIAGIGKARSQQEVMADALFPVTSVFNVSDWTSLAASDQGILYSVFKDCQDDSDQQGRIGSRSSFLASVAVNAGRHFGENEIKAHCLNAIQNSQPNNVAAELSKAAIEDPLLERAPPDELLAAYFRLRFPKLVLMLKTMQEYFPLRDLPQPNQGMSACCRLFYQKHADPGLAQGCLEEPCLQECYRPEHFKDLLRGGEGKGCKECARQEDHFCSKNYDGLGLLGPPSVPSFSRFAALKRKGPLLVNILEAVYPVLRDMLWSSPPTTEDLCQADLPTLQAMFDSLQGEVEGLLADLHQAYDNLVSIAQEGLSRPAPELQEQAQRLGQQLQNIKTQAACLGQQQQQQNGASDAASGVCQALSSAAGQQLQQMCKSLAKLLQDSRELPKKQGGALCVYTIIHSLDGEVNEGSGEYMLAKCWAHYPTPESWDSSAAIPLDADRGGYLLVPIPLMPAHQLRAAIDSTNSSTAPELRKSLACPGGSRCSKVVKSFLGGESVQCHALHGPFLEPHCKLCQPPPPYSAGTAACVDHVCTTTFYGGYQPVDLRGDAEQLMLHEMHDFELQSGSEGSGIYTSSTCARYASQNFIFVRMAYGIPRRRVPLNWSPDQADCVFGAQCPYPVSCLFHHGRLDKPQEPLRPLQDQCSKCSKCLEAMQYQQLLEELQQKHKEVAWSCYWKEEQLDGYEGNEGQLTLLLQGQIQDLQQERQELLGRVEQVQRQLEQFDQDKQQLDHICTRRMYSCFMASRKPDYLCSGGIQMVQVSPPSGPVRGAAPGLYALRTHAARESCHKYVAAVQHVMLPQYSSSHFIVVPLRVYSGRSEDKCASGCSCPDGLACPKDHSPPGMQPCTDQRHAPTLGAAGVLSFKQASLGAGNPLHEPQPKATPEGGPQASSSTPANGLGVSSSKGAPTRADMPSAQQGQPAAAPMGIAGSSFKVAGPSTGMTRSAGTTPSAAGERNEATTASAAKGKKGKKKGNNEETFSLADMRGK